MTATVPGGKYAVHLRYVDGFDIAEQFTGPWAAEHATAFFAHAVMLPGAVTVWLTRSPWGSVTTDESSEESGRTG